MRCAPPPPARGEKDLKVLFRSHLWELAQAATDLERAERDLEATNSGSAFTVRNKLRTEVEDRIDELFDDAVEAFEPDEKETP
jgi:hypothetical protein